MYVFNCRNNIKEIKDRNLYCLYTSEICQNAKLYEERFSGV